MGGGENSFPSCFYILEKLNEFGKIFCHKILFRQGHYQENWRKWHVLNTCWVGHHEEILLHHSFENMFVLSRWYSYCSSLLLTLLPSYLLSTQLKCTWEMNRRRESTLVSHTSSWKECCKCYLWLNLNPCIICIVVNMCNKRLRESIHKTVPIHLFTCAFVIMKLNDMFSVTHVLTFYLWLFIRITAKK